MNYKNHILTFEKTSDFDGMTDSNIQGTKELITGKCTRYYRSGYHRSWYIIDENEKERYFNTTFNTLKAIDGKEV